MLGGCSNQSQNEELGRSREGRRTSIRGLPALLAPNGGYSNPLRFGNELTVSSLGGQGLDHRNGATGGGLRPSAPVGFASSLSQTVIPEELGQSGKSPPNSAGLPEEEDAKKTTKTNDKCERNPESAGQREEEERKLKQNQHLAPDDSRFPSQHKIYRTPSKEWPHSCPLQNSDLALAGPPWAKEGMISRKIFTGPGGKRSKDKTWLDVFAVVHAPGTLSMFRFDSASPPASSRNTDWTKGTDAVATGTFGGGNWALNAQLVGEIPLQHSFAQAVSPLAYSRSRPHVVALHLANKAVVYLQTSHEGLVVEWCASLNYWAARASQLPLEQGVTSVDYGWKPLEESDPLMDVNTPYPPGGSVSTTTVRQSPPESSSVNSGKQALSPPPGPPPSSQLLSPLDRSEGSLVPTGSSSHSASNPGSSSHSLVALTRPSTSGTDPTSLQTSSVLSSSLNHKENSTARPDDASPGVPSANEQGLLQPSAMSLSMRRGSSNDMGRSISSVGFYHPPQASARRGLTGLSKALRGLGARVTGTEPGGQVVACSSGQDTSGSSVGRMGQGSMSGWRFPSLGGGDASNSSFGSAIGTGSNSHHKGHAHERDFIGTWLPPPPPQNVSPLPEEEQLTALQDAVIRTEHVLAQHQGFRVPTLARFHPRGPNHALVRANWDNRQQYLMDELSKYRLYVAALRGSRDKQSRLRRRADGAIVDPMVDPIDDDDEEEGELTTHTLIHHHPPTPSHTTSPAANVPAPPDTDKATNKSTPLTTTSNPSIPPYHPSPISPEADLSSHATMPSKKEGTQRSGSAITSTGPVQLGPVSQ